MDEPIARRTKEQASRSGGASDRVIYGMVERALARRGIRGKTVADFGCGGGALRGVLQPLFTEYIGVDAVRYPNFPADATLIETDLNAREYPLATGSMDAVLAVETIEHLENPRALLREMARVARPGGWLVVTTPNQLSWLSLGTLLFKRRFSAFQDIHYPAHVTALLECDLLRMAGELGLADTAIEHSLSGRMALTPLHFPVWLSRLFPRGLSDNLLLIGRKP